LPFFLPFSLYRLYRYMPTLHIYSVMCRGPGIMGTCVPSSHLGSIDLHNSEPMGKLLNLLEGRILCRREKHSMLENSSMLAKRACFRCQVSARSFETSAGAPRLAFHLVTCNRVTKTPIQANFYLPYTSLWHNAMRTGFNVAKHSSIWHS
jgi:hypothetical protein